MICDKCGKSNISELSQCAYCGEKMPQTSGGGGFSDILTYNSVHKIPTAINPYMPVFGKETKSEGVSEEEMQKLIKKSDNIIKSTRINSLFGLIAIGLSFIVLISSIVFGITTVNSVKKYKEETILKLVETKKELTEYQSRLDTIIKKLEEANSDDTGEDLSVSDNANNPETSENENNNTTDSVPDATESTSSEETSI